MSKKSPQKKKPLRVFEAFAGIGAQKAALELLKKEFGLNYEVVGISDWFIHAIIAYDAIHNFDLPPVELPDEAEQIKYLKQFQFSWDSVNQIKEVEKLSKKMRERLYQANKRTRNLGSITDVTGENFPDSDLLVYSFPCQDLSTGGKGAGMAKTANTRSGLVWQIERILKELKQRDALPKYLLMENVSTILSPRHKVELDKWLSFLEGMGYINEEPMNLNAKDFGVPQERSRTFIISHLGKRKLNLLPKLKKQERVKTTDFLKIDYSNPTFKKEADVAKLKLTPSRQEMWRINGREISPDTIIRTITCNMDRTNTTVLFRYEDSIRRLTIREAFLMMGFSEEDYERLHKAGFTYRQENKLIGNAIVVNVLKEIFRLMFVK